MDSQNPQGRHSESMSWIFVFAASKMEADPLARLLGVSRWNSGSHAGPITAGPNQLRFFITGIGPKRAGERASEILPSAPPPARDQQKEKPDAAIVIGLCGGLTDLLPETAIVTYSSCLSAMNDGIRCPCAPPAFRTNHCAIECPKRPLQIGDRHHVSTDSNYQR